MVRAFRERKKNRLKDIVVISCLLTFTAGAIFYILFPEKFRFKAIKITEPTEITEPEEVEKTKKPHYDYQVTTLIDEEYFPVVHEALEKAKKSIYVAMYAAKKEEDPDSPVNQLLDDLIQAHNRGVTVKVLVEEPSPKLESYKGLHKSNKGVIDYLSEAGVEAEFDSPKIETHDKLILIDGDTIIIGAHNWTYSALKLNRETSVLIKSSPINPEFKQYFDSLEKQREEKR